MQKPEPPLTLDSAWLVSVCLQMHCLEALQATKFTPTTPRCTLYVFQIMKNVYVGRENTLHVLKRHARRQGGHSSVEGADIKLKERGKNNEK
jgi:hypothetical protein